MPKESAETIRHKAQGARENLKPWVFGLEPLAIILYLRLFLVNRPTILQRHFLKYYS